MNTPKLILCAASLLAVGTLPLTVNAAEAAILEDEGPPAYRPWTLGAEFGSTGIGGSLSWRFADHWGVRTGFDYFQWTEDDYEIKNLHFDAKIRVMSEPLTLDIYPWTRSSFHISAGVQFNQNKLTGNAVDTRVPPSILGDINLTIQQQLVNPYLSIAGNFFYFDHAHHWAFGGELGVAYTGEPRVSLTSTRSGPGINAALKAEQSKIQDYANQFKWWPVVKLMVTYSF